MNKFDTARWNFVRKVKHMRYYLSKSYTKTYRFILRLPQLQTTDIEYMFVAPEDELSPGGGRTVDSEKLNAMVNNHADFYQAKPRREYVCEQIGDFIFYNNIYGVPRAIWRWINNKIDWFVFYRARSFKYESFHYVNKATESHIDSYLMYKWGSFNRRLTVDISSPKSSQYDAEMSRDDNDTGIKYNDWHAEGGPSYVILSMPHSEFIDIEAIPDLLATWYADKVRYRYHHWTVKEGTMPTFSGELSYQDDQASATDEVFSW